MTTISSHYGIYGRWIMAACGHAHPYRLAMERLESRNSYVCETNTQLRHVIIIQNCCACIAIIRNNGLVYTQPSPIPIHFGMNFSDVNGLVSVHFNSLFSPEWSKLGLEISDCKRFGSKRSEYYQHIICNQLTATKTKAKI